MATTATRNDPYSNFNFVVEIEGIPDGTFTECSGLCSETEAIHYREGGQFGVRVLPGRTNYSAITLKRGITADLSLWNWYKATAQGHPDRRKADHPPRRRAETSRALGLRRGLAREVPAARR